MTEPYVDGTYVKVVKVADEFTVKIKPGVPRSNFVFTFLVIQACQPCRQELVSGFLILQGFRIVSDFSN